jgi:hypothetical protein
MVSCAPFAPCVVWRYRRCRASQELDIPCSRDRPLYRYDRKWIDERRDGERARDLRVGYPAAQAMLGYKIASARQQPHFKQITPS